VPDGDEERDDGPPLKKAKARDDKYAIPTMEEASLLRETEGKLFEGNLLRLEVEELLAEVRVDHGKKSVKSLEVRYENALGAGRGRSQTENSQKNQVRIAITAANLAGCSYSLAGYHRLLVQK